MSRRESDHGFTTHTISARAGANYYAAWFAARRMNERRSQAVRIIQAGQANRRAAKINLAPVKLPPERAE